MAENMFFNFLMAQILTKITVSVWNRMSKIYFFGTCFKFESKLNTKQSTRTIFISKIILNITNISATSLPVRILAFITRFIF